MYLIVWPSANPKQVQENLTVVDLLAAAQGLCQIFRFRGHFEKLVFDRDKAIWVTVAEARVLSCETGQIHV